MKTRGVVAMSGTFGYELDITKLSEEDKQTVKEQIEAFKKYYDLIQNGDYYRLTDDGRKSPFVAWEFVSADKKEALLNVVVLRTKANPILHTVYARGLEADMMYQVEGSQQKFSGAALMNGGYPIPVMGDDYQAVQIHLLVCE